MNKKLEESSGLPFIQTSKVVTSYLNIKKISDIKRIINENTNRDNAMSLLRRDINRIFKILI